MRVSNWITPDGLWAMLAAGWRERRRFNTEGRVVVELARAGVTTFRSLVDPAAPAQLQIAL